MTKKYIILTFLFISMTTILVSCAGPQEEDSDIADEISDVEASNDSASADESPDDFDSKEEFGESEMADTESELESFEDAEIAEGPVESQAAEELSPQEPAENIPGENVAQEQAPVNQVQAINYLDSSQGGAIEIKTSKDAVYVVRPSTNANQYIIEIENAALDEALRRPYIMKDFEGAFGTVNAYQNPGGRTARVVVQMKRSGEPVVTQQGNTLLITAPGLGDTGPVVAAAPTEPENEDDGSYNTKLAAQDEKILGARTLDEFLTGSGRFFGRPISIQVNSAEVRDVIGFIAEQSGVNLVISDDVEGKVSLKLRQVPWDQALVIVMRAKGLGYVRQGNVLRITKLATLQAEAEAAKKIVESQKSLSPLKVKVMPINFATVEDLEKQVKSFLTDGRGKVVGDSRTSTIIITDTAEVLQKVERLIKELDIPPAQVMIEGKIVEASESFTRRLGVNWSLTGAPTQLSSSGGRNGSPVLLTQSLNFQNMKAEQAAAGNAFLNLNVGSFDLLGSLDATLSLAQADNLVRIISSPRIVTMNKEKAEISQKSEVITLNTLIDQNGNISASSKAIPVELKLTVTPQITAEGSVVLDLDVMRQFPGAEADAITKAKPINTRSAKTKVLVSNGQTAVVGGIYQSDETESETGVPGLKNIPILGWLFKQKTEERTKTELLLFLTPRILNAKDQGVGG